MYLGSGLSAGEAVYEHVDDVFGELFDRQLSG